MIKNISYTLLTIYILAFPELFKEFPLEKSLIFVNKIINKLYTIHTVNIIF